MKSKSTSRKEERSQLLREQILASARRLFAEKGYENVTLRAVAEEIGYSHSAIYKHFTNKSQLMDEICREAFSLLSVEIESLSTANTEPRERLFGVSRGVVAFCLAHPQHFRLLFLGPDDRNGMQAGRFITMIGLPVFLRLNVILEECLHAAGIQVPDTRLAAHTWWTSMFGLVMAFIVQGDLPEVAPQLLMVEQSISMMWAGMDGLSPARAAAFKQSRRRSRDS